MKPTNRTTTNRTTTTRRVARAMAAIALSLLGNTFSAPVLAAGNDARNAAEARYRQDRAACLSGATHQDRDTCLREAGAALQAARAGRLADEGAAPARLDANALARCAPLPGADREDCVARVHGAGTVSGSVEGGGVYRELSTTTVVQPRARQGQ